MIRPKVKARLPISPLRDTPVSLDHFSFLHFHTVILPPGATWRFLLPEAKQGGRSFSGRKNRCAQPG